MKLLTAHEIAEALGVTRAWVYSHAQELGAIRLGTGPKPRLRFEVDLVAERLAARSVSEQSELQGPAPQRASRSPRVSRTGSSTDLLPIKRTKPTRKDTK